MLTGKRLLITGVVTRDSIAFEVARQAQEAGAEIVLTGFGRARRLTERAAAKLPEPADVLSPRSPRSSTAAGARWTASCTRSPSPPPTRSAVGSWMRPQRAR